MLGRLTQLAIGRRSRWIVIAVWIVLAVGLGWLQPRLQARAADESETFRARGADSTLAHQALKERFREGRWSTAILAYVARKGSIYEYSPRIAADQDKLCSTETLPNLVGIGSPSGTVCGEIGHVLGPQTGPSAFSSDSPESMIMLPVFNSKDDTESVVRDVAAIRKILPGPDGTPLSSYVTGQAGFDADRSNALEGIDGTLLAITGVLVLVLMLFTYRSPLIAGVMLAAVGAAYLVSTGILYGLVEAGATTVSGQSTAILIVLMFGSGTDYALLLVSRYRDELRRTGDTSASIAVAAESTRPPILASGSIVVAAMLVLGLADFNATREMGPILALGILVMMAASLTLLPAVLAALGRRAFWPVKPKLEPVRQAGDTPAWQRVAALVRRHPRLLAGGCIALLALGALGNLHDRGYLTLSEQYRDKPESVLAQDLIAKRYAPGRVAPLEVVVDGEMASQVRDDLAGHPNVTDSMTDSQSEDGNLISLEVILDRDPFSRSAMDLIPSLRRTASEHAGDAKVWVGGITAEQHDNLNALSRDAKLIVPLVLLLILAILMILLRAVIAPLYVIGTVVLSFGFALGASSLIFTHLLGQPDSDPNLSIFAFIFLVALGVDDNIFLMTGIREQHARGLPTREAVLVGLQRTGSVITSAGLILAGTFAALMALELEALFQVGFTVTLGLLVDAFIVRIFLVPSIAWLLDDWNWWPNSGAFAGTTSKDVALSTGDG
ncbi:MAG TPA: MMPL family transporter [Solirubrobacter sp.]|nr:MMPL family transporter [Solirubrobacter sp.]